MEVPSETKNMQEQLFDLLGPVATGLLSLAGPYGVASASVIGTYLSYRQRRQVNNLNRVIQELRNRRPLVEDIKANPKEYLPLLETLFDYAVDEAQAEKINILVNGLETAVNTDCIQEDIFLSFYDTLKDLRKGDIALLRLLNIKGSQLQRVDIEELGLTDEQVQATMDKLVRLGLLEDTLMQSIKELYKYLRTQNPSTRNGLERRASGLSYDDNLKREISEYGRQFIDFFVLNS